MLFLGSDDASQGLPIPSIPSDVPITLPTMDRMRFGVPGAGLFTHRFEPQQIPPGSGTEIFSPEQLDAPDPKAAFLAMIRQRVAPIYEAMAEITDPAERHAALKLAFAPYRAGSTERIENMAYRLVAQGMPASAALREAIARELAATILTGPTNTDTVPELTVASGLGGFWSSVGKGLKKVGKTVAKVVGGVADVVEAVSCGAGEAIGKVADHVGGKGAGKSARKISKVGCDVARGVNDTICAAGGGHCRKQPKPKPRQQSRPRPQAAPRPQVVVQAPRPAPAPRIVVQAPRQLPPPPAPNHMPIVLAVLGAGALLTVGLVASRGK